MEADDIQSKPYHDFVRENQPDKIFLGKKFFTGEFRYFVATVSATNISVLLLLVFSAIVVN